ncbi:MAG: hypothetical protein AN485_16015 [Anabaena sp. MDT14b]|nr:MAG: hypothetical protein AN485_16015 [Anabaena sp. MDT14b]
MAITDKDKLQKEKAIRFCVSNNLIPYLEVNVSNVKDISPNQTVLTDIDVLGIEINKHGQVRKIIFDCKTLDTSPINRAFWACGLMNYTSCNEAFVILKKKAEETHKLSAKSINVHLYSDELFDSYAEANNINYLDTSSYTADINTWYKYLDYFKNQIKFKELGDYINNQLPLEVDYARGLRGIIAYVKDIKGEINPIKDFHMSIYVHLVMSLCFVLSPIVTDLINIFDPNHKKEDFERMLRYYIWGGKDNFILRKKLHELMGIQNEQISSEFELANWDEFVELVRAILDAPTHLSSSCIPLREISLRYLTNINQSADLLIAKRLTESNRIRQFIFRISSYLINATGLPKDCDLNLRQLVNQFMSNL